MEQRTIVVQLEPGSAGEILFAAPLDGEARAFGVVSETLERSGSTLSAALGMVRAVAETATKTLSELKVAGVELTVGVKLTGKGQFVIAECSAEASLNVKITLK